MVRVRFTGFLIGRGLLRWLRVPVAFEAELPLGMEKAIALRLGPSLSLEGSLGVSRAHQ